MPHPRSRHLSVRRRAPMPHSEDVPQEAVAESTCEAEEDVAEQVRPADSPASVRVGTTAVSHEKLLSLRA